MDCRIGELKVKIGGTSDIMKRQCLPYQTDAFEMADVDLTYTAEDIARYQGVFNEDDYFEYNYTMSKFAQEVLRYDGICFHASALYVDGEGILFSADSGTGKSTHARLWRKYMTSHHILAINDDKPLIRIQHGKPMVYGTPWAGKHCVHTNIQAPVKALVFLSQGKENKIKQIPSKDAFKLVFAQVLGGKNQASIAKLMDLLDIFMREVPIYHLECTISEEAVKLVYETVWRIKDEN